MGDLAFQFYEGGDAVDNVTKLGEELILSANKAKIIKDSYKSEVFHELDLEDIIDKFAFISEYSRAITVLSGKEWASKTPNSNIIVEPWFQTKYTLTSKPVIEMEEVLGEVKLPSKSRFIPRDFTLYSKEKHERNPHPVKVSEKPGFESYLMQDHVF